MASHDTTVANAMVAARLLQLQFDPSLLDDDMQARNVVKEPFARKFMSACNVIGKDATDLQAEQQPQVTVAPINGSDSGDEEAQSRPANLTKSLECALQDATAGVFQGTRPLDDSLSDSDDEEAQSRRVKLAESLECALQDAKAGVFQDTQPDLDDSFSDSDDEEVQSRRAELTESLECALQDAKAAVFQGTQPDLDDSLREVKLCSLESFWFYYNEFEDWFDAELNEFDSAALNLIGTYVELKEDVDALCYCSDRDSKIWQLLEQLGEKQVWMTRDFLNAVRDREDAQTYGMEVLRDFYGEDYW
jgi:hypothetical protein